MRAISEKEGRSIVMLTEEDHKFEKKTFSLMEPSGSVSYTVSGDICYIEMLAVRKPGLGNGTILYREWEKEIGSQSSAIVLMCINTLEANIFWKKMGFSDLYLTTSDEDEVAPPVMIKPIDPNLEIEAAPYGCLISTRLRSPSP
jgi:hypothetical protein